MFMHRVLVVVLVCAQAAAIHWSGVLSLLGGHSSMFWCVKLGSTSLLVTYSIP